MSICLAKTELLLYIGYVRFIVYLSVLMIIYQCCIELWNDISDIVKETGDNRVPKTKRKKVTKWLSDEAVNIADERR